MGEPAINFSRTLRRFIWPPRGGGARAAYARGRPSDVPCQITFHQEQLLPNSTACAFSTRMERRAAGLGFDLVH